MNNLNDDNENFLTHKGQKVGGTENYSDDDYVQSDDEMYDKLDNYMNEIENAPDTKLSRKEIIQNIIEKSKQMKLEKQNQKRKTLEQIKLLDENFPELSELIARRPRGVGRLNDDFERMANSYNYLDKTKPTERIKSDKEIELEKENEAKKKMKQLIREDTDSEDEDDQNNSHEEDKKAKKNAVNSDEDSEDLNAHPDKNAENDNIKRPLTKKERIIKLMEKRLNKSATKVDKEDISLLKKKRGRIEKKEEESVESENEREENEDDYEEDNLSDLEEFDDRKGKRKKGKNKAEINDDDNEIEEEEKDFNEEGESDEYEDFGDNENEEGEIYEDDEYEDQVDQVATSRKYIHPERGDNNDNNDFEDDEEYSDDIDALSQ